MKELVVISGKGGTGKTSITSSFAALADKKVMVDCDVDASNLHLIVKPEIKESFDFQGGNEAVFNSKKCLDCKKCLNICNFDAITVQNDKYVIDPYKCEGCGVCAWFCPAKKIEMKTKHSGKWHLSETRHGDFVHADLNIGEENSGKLVSKIRETARNIAKKNNLDLIITDGAPGTSCPVIASITGSDLALIVTEPTISGFHDMERVIKLLNHFKIKGVVCINKYDLSPEMTEEIETFCEKTNTDVISKIPYDNDFVKAQINEQSIVEYSKGKASRSVEALWLIILKLLQK